MIRPPPISTLTDTRFPYTALCRSLERELRGCCRSSGRGYPCRQDDLVDTSLRNSRRRRHQPDAVGNEFDLGVGVDSQRFSQAGDEARFEMRDPGVGAAELLVEFRPGNDRRPAQRMQAVKAPAVDVVRGTARPNQANRPALARTERPGETGSEPGRA